MEQVTRKEGGRGSRIPSTVLPEVAMRTNTTDAEEFDGNSERETTIERRMAMDIPIPEDVVEHAQERYEERPGGVLEDYIVECVDISVCVENAPE